MTYARLLLARSRFVILAVALALFVLPGIVSAQVSTGSGFYQQTNLTSNLPGIAKKTDPNLTNAWGISSGPGGPFWVSDNGSGKSTLYDNHGSRQPLVVTVPPAAGGKVGSPTGTVFNSDTNAFIVSKNGVSGASIFLFDSEDGTISGWNASVDRTHAILAVDNSRSGAVYTGLAIGTNQSGIFLYAANFHAGTIDVFDKNFASATLSGSFYDPYLPSNYAPFNIENIGGILYVAYAQQNAKKTGPVPGSGHGFIATFDTNGNLIRHLIFRGKLNAPWGMALVGKGFGTFSHDLLIGNFGNGYINVFNPYTGAFLGSLSGQNGKPLIIRGLWALMFGLGGQAGKATQLFFTAGPQHETNGLFGVIQSM